MPQARDEAGNIWEVDAQGNPVRLVQPAQSGPTVLQAPPAQQYEAPKAAAEVAKTQAQAIEAQVGAQQAQTELAREQERLDRKRINSIYSTNDVLTAIRQARKIAQQDGGTGWSSLLQGVPTTNARRLSGELDTIRGNLSFDRLQQMRDESTTGGALGSITEGELRLLGSTVASLDQGADVQTFLDRLDRIERSFIRAQVAAEGIDPESPEGRKVFKQDYGYTGVFEDEVKRPETRLGGAGATTTSEAVPPEYQSAVTRYLRDNWGNIDPREYAAFRANLDQQFGFRGLPPSEYAAGVVELNQYADKGGSPDKVPVVPQERELSAIEQGINQITLSPGGTAFANASNALLGGLPVRLAGGQQNLELLREANPVSSFTGELVGNVGGAYLGGGLAAKAGLGLLARPLASETAYGALYGATQDEDPLRGAAVGGGLALAGGAIGNKIGQALPDTFAPGAIREAEAQIPTVDDLKTLAGEQYQAVQSRGAIASGDDTTRLAENLAKALRKDGRIDANGNLIDENTPITKAYSLINSFAGKEMTPVQAGAVRDVLSEGRAVGTPNERRIAGNLVRQFDEWADPVLPGIEVPRATAQRYLQGQAIQQRTNIGTIRGQRAKGNDVGDSIRTQFGQLDEAIERGDEFFEPVSREAIALAARGDGTTNALRNVGKYGFGSVLPTAGITGAGLSTAFANTDPLLAAIPLGIGALGTASRRLAEQRTLRAAKNAELLALGGPEADELLRLARQQSGINAGRGLGGLFGGGGSMATRQQQPLPRR